MTEAQEGQRYNVCHSPQDDDLDWEVWDDGSEWPEPQHIASCYSEETAILIASALNRAALLERAEEALADWRAIDSGSSAVRSRVAREKRDVLLSDLRATREGKGNE